MGLNWDYVKLMDRRGMLTPGMRVLDIGSSNLYCADAGEVAAFLAKYAPDTPAGEARALAQRLADGSGFDIALGYKTVVLDFNKRPLPAEYRGAFDLVLNFGTTEHVFHQFNSFKIIHEATRPGGLMWHQVPVSGYTDHCYFTYTGRFFFELASYNGYELAGFWFSAGGETNLFDSVRSYASYYPLLAEFLDDPTAVPQPTADLKITNVCINTILRKVEDRPFMGSIERSTSVGDIPDSVIEAYDAHRAEPAGRPRSVAGWVPGRGLWAPIRRLKPVLKPVLKPLLNALRGRAAR
jgi:hypothetical protein